MNAPAAPPHATRPLSAELARLRDMFAEKPATLREIIGALAGRGWELLIILFTLPVMSPVTVLGMSLVFGLPVVVVSSQLALGRPPWLPRWLLDKQLPPGFLAKVLGATRGAVAALERVLRPRALAVTGAPWLNRLHLLVLCLAGLLMAQPLPVPLTHKLPAITILLLAAGLMERDGVCIIAGYASLGLTIAWFVAVGAAIQKSIEDLRQWFGH